MISSQSPLPMPARMAALRIIDANFNRATEGLRVVEEHCRFALEDRHLTEACKQLRHDVVAAIGQIPAADLHAARQTQSDVGTTISAPTEMRRDSPAQIAAASWQRVEQALRAIEEFAKLLAPQLAAEIEQQRYRAYTLAKACLVTADSQPRLAQARLYVLLDGCSSDSEFANRAKRLIDAGVHILQLRDKKLDDRTLLSRARLLRQIIDERKGQESVVGGQESVVRVQGSGFRVQGSGVGVPIRNPQSAIRNHQPPAPSSQPLDSSPQPLFILNDRPDLAVLARADGVHLGQEDLAVRDARQIVGPEMLIGVSSHTIEQARQAVLDGANYLGCGPTFPSQTKHFDRFPGLNFLRQVAAEISLPAFAIGGINRENLQQVLSTGIKRIAVGGALGQTGSASETVASFLTALAQRA